MNAEVRKKLDSVLAKLGKRRWVRTRLVQQELSKIGHRINVETTKVLLSEAALLSDVTKDGHRYWWTGGDYAGQEWLKVRG